MSEKYELKPLSEVSFDVQFRWALGLLASLLFMPKKHLRAAWRIIKNPQLQTEITEKSEKFKAVRRIFSYGFRKFSIERKGKKRDILAPHPGVQMIFKAIQNWLERISPSHQNAYGFVKKRSPKKAVEALLKNRRYPLFLNKHFLRFDISDAFPSITLEMVEAALKRIGVNEGIIEILAQMVTYQKKLPQGSSCSPAILNRVYVPMCEEIDAICRENGISWIVYADDFNFAGLDIAQEVKNQLLAVPLKYGFQIKPEKTKDNLGKTVPHILGLTIVDGRTHIKRRQKKKFRRIIFEARKYKDHSSERIKGIIGEIRQIYGEEKNWPGWLQKPRKEYQAEKEELNETERKRTIR